MTDLHVFISAFIFAAALVYMLAPLAGKPRLITDPSVTSVAQTEAALRRRKDMLYQSIRDADLDRSTGKLSEEDYQDMVRELKQQAAAVIRELDALADPAVAEETASAKNPS